MMKTRPLILALLLGLRLHALAAGDSLDGYVNHGLVGVGRLSAELFDKAGDGHQDTLGGFSAMAVEPGSVVRSGNTLKGTLIGLPDRGYGDGSTDYHPRMEIFHFQITPQPGNGPAEPGQLLFTNVETRLLTWGGGRLFTGFDAGNSNSTTVPQSAAGSPGAGRRSIDPEGLVLNADGSFWVSDEYGPGIFQFSATRELQMMILPPAALVPRLGGYPGTVHFSASAAPTSGRRNNRGLEGLTITPDGRRLVAILQSPTQQDAGGGTLGRNTRILQMDAVAGSPTFGRTVAEYVFPLSLDGSAVTNKHTPVNELLSLSPTTFLVLERDSAGLGSGTNIAPHHKKLVLCSTVGATDIAGTGYDLEPGAPGALSLPADRLPPGLQPVRRRDFINLLDPVQLARFGVNLKAEADANTLSEKWEALALVPMKDPSRPTDYLLLVGNDNDFKASVAHHNGVPVGTNAVPVDHMILAYHITLPPGEPGLNAPAR